MRADGPTQAFHLERLDGERWRSVAAFSVNLNVCKPPEPPPAPLFPPPSRPAATMPSPGEIPNRLAALRSLTPLSLGRPRLTRGSLRSLHVS